MQLGLKAQSVDGTSTIRRRINAILQMRHALRFTVLSTLVTNSGSDLEKNQQPRSLQPLSLTEFYAL